MKLSIAVSSYPCVSLSVLYSMRVQARTDKETEVAAAQHAAELRRQVRVLESLGALSSLQLHLLS